MIYNHERSESSWKTYSGPAPKFPDYKEEVEDRCRSYFRSRHLNWKLAALNGWYPTRTDVERVVIPCNNSEGTVYYQARALDFITKLRYDSPVAPRGDSHVLVYPHKTLKGSAVIVEGPMDALAAADFGYLGIAVMGNNPSAEMLDLIVKRYGKSWVPFLIVPDKDCLTFGAGLVSQFAARGVKSRMVMLPNAKDICEMTLAQREKFFKKI